MNKITEDNVKKKQQFKEANKNLLTRKKTLPPPLMAPTTTTNTCLEAANYSNNKKFKGKQKYFKSTFLKIKILTFST